MQGREVSHGEHGGHGEDRNIGERSRQVLVEESGKCHGPGTGKNAFLHQAEAMSDIQFALGDRKIDMVLANPEGSDEDLIDARPVVRISRATGIVL